MVKTICAVILLLAVAVTAQITLPGNCPDIDTVSEFDVNSYMGLWYEVSYGKISIKYELCF